MQVAIWWILILALILLFEQEQARVSLKRSFYLNKKTRCEKSGESSFLFAG